MKFGSITTGIIADGLVFNLDVENLASFSQNNTKIINTLDTSISGSFEGAPTFNDSSFDYLNFDGVDDWIRIKDGDFPSNRTAFTVEWVFSPWANHGGWKNPAISKWQTGGGNYNEWSIGVKDSSGPSAFSWTIFSAANTYVQINTELGGLDYTAGNWYHQVGTFDGANNGLMSQYVNGVGYSSSFSGYSECKTYSGQDVALSNFGSSYQYESKCNIARFAYYNRALSSNEVLHNYNALKGRFGL